MRGLGFRAGVSGLRLRVFGLLSLRVVGCRVYNQGLGFSSSFGLLRFRVQDIRRPGFRV